jgi:hypothetical protein
LQISTMYDKDISPVGWYAGSYLLRFVEVEQEGNFDPEERFHSWENTVLVKADSMEEARSKVEQIARAETEPYQGRQRGAGAVAL